MRLYTLLVVSALLQVVEIQAQEKKHYHIAPVEESRKVKLNVNAASVNCRINATYNSHAVSVYGYPRSSSFNPVEQSAVNNQTRNITLDFEDGSTQDLSTSLSSHVFNGFSSKSRGPEKPWYIYLSRNVPYDLSLNYGMGSSSVDLSGLAVEKLKVSTGSANLRVGYAADKPNDVSMDTFYTKVDLGVLQLDHLNLTRAREVIADVGFGKLLMHFSDDMLEESIVRASVGAGTLKVSFENIETPVIVRINDSPLCRVKMPKSFRKVEQNTFVNEFYREEAEKILSFDIDVSVGNVEFTTDD